MSYVLSVIVIHIRKSIKKASKLIAKAISQKTDESELEISLVEKTDVKKVSVAKRKRKARKQTTTSGKRSKAKVVSKKTPFVKAVAKTNVSPKIASDIKSEKAVTAN